MKDKISMRQAGVISAFCILSNKILILPSLMYGQTKADSIFLITLMFAIDFLALPIFFKLKKTYPNLKLFELLSKFLTKYIAKLIFGVLIVYMLFKALLTFSIVYDYFKQQIYQDEFIWIAIICIVPVMNHAVLTGLKPAARTMELFFGVVISGIFIIFFISFFTHISLPILFVSTAKQIFSGTFRYVFVFGDFILMFLLMDKIDYNKNEKKKIYIPSAVAMIIVIAVFFIFYSKYQVTAFMHNNALADILVFSVQFNAIGRLDIIAMITIMTLATFQMEIFCLAFCESFVNVFPLLNKKWAVVVFDISFFTLYYLYIGKFEIIVGSSLTWLAILGVFVAYILPLLFFILCFIRRKNE